MLRRDKKYQRKEGINLEIDGEIWHRVSSFSDSHSNDKHFVWEIDDEGMVLICFGDGKHGARPQTGSKNIRVTFPSKKRFRGVILQQGQVQLDSDWHEDKASCGPFCSIYRGHVINNADPQSLMRLLVQVPEVLGRKEVWALPCIPIGTYGVPAIGSVWIMFEGGDPDHPVWMGGGAGFALTSEQTKHAKTSQRWS